MSPRETADLSGAGDRLRKHRFTWPVSPLKSSPSWLQTGEHLARFMPESPDALARDSQWPAFFPSPICLISATDGERTVLEREVGASIVNRFPYVVAVSVCRDALSKRHHPRATFIEVLERGGVAALQFLEPGPELDAVLTTIAGTSEDAPDRVELTGLPVRRAVTNDAPVFEHAFLVYEARLVRPQRDFDSATIYEQPWVDVGSHRVFFLEINAIALAEDIASGRSQIRWRSLPSWEPTNADPVREETAGVAISGYQKGYTPRYAFPSSTTAAFEYDEVVGTRAVKHLPPLPEDQVEVDNDRARWPCFFPSSAGLITTWDEDGQPNLMPCGSTTVVSRSPLVIAPCVSYARINARYARRHSLEVIRKQGRFGCGVPYLSEPIVSAVKYAGNTSFARDPHKLRNSGLHLGPFSEYGPILTESPIHFDCEVIDELRLGTHVMFLGAVRRIFVRTDVTPENPLEWYPWATVTATGAPAPV